VSKPTAAEMAIVAQQNVIDGFMPYLKAEVDRQLAVVCSTACGAIRSGDLTPERAASLWHQYAAISAILRAFETRLRVGTSIGERHKEALTSGML
jgi:hypothetical protein